MFGWDFTDSDNFEGQRSNVSKYPSDYSLVPTCPKAAFIMYYLVGGEDFLGGYKNFQDEIGGIGNFQLIYRGMSNFHLILINSVGLHYKLI